MSSPGAVAARPLLGADRREWVQATHRARPLVPLTPVAWLVLGGLLVGGGDGGPCTDTDPCIPDYGSVALVVAYLSLMVLLVLLPPVGLALAPLVALVAGAALVADGGHPSAVVVAGILIVLTVTAMAAVVDARRPRVGAAFDGAPQDSWPGPGPLEPRGTNTQRAGIALLVLGLIVAGSGAAYAGVQHARETHARRLPATVARVNLDGAFLTLDLPDQEADLDVDYPEDFSVGDRFDVLVDEHGPFRLAAEPADASAPLGSGALLAATGGALLVRGRRRRRQDAVALSGPQPQLAVRCLPWGAGVALFAADDVLAQDGAFARIPAVHAVGVPADELTAQLRAASSGGVTEPAVLVGAPSAGRLVGVRTAHHLLVPAAGLRLLPARR